MRKWIGMNATVWASIVLSCSIISFSNIVFSIPTTTERMPTITVMYCGIRSIITLFDYDAIEHLTYV